MPSRNRVGQPGGRLIQPPGHYPLEEPAIHQLTIATDTATSTTGHDDFADAHRALMSGQPRPGRQPAPQHRDRHHRAHPAKPVMSRYYSAEATLRWTADHTATAVAFTVMAGRFVHRRGPCE